MTDSIHYGVILLILCSGACMTGSDFIAILALLTAMFAIRNLIFQSFPLVHCDSNLQQLAKGFFTRRRYSVVGFHTEQNIRSYTCLLDVSFMSVYLFLVCCIVSNSLPLDEYVLGMKFYVVVNFILTMIVMVWHLYQFYSVYKTVDKYCIYLGTLIIAFLHFLAYYGCIAIKDQFTEIDLVLNPVILIVVVLLLFSISYYPYTIEQDCLFSIHFGIEDDEIKISDRDGKIVSSIEKPFIPVILDNGDILIYAISDKCKNLDRVIKAKEVTEFSHTDENFVFNTRTRKWYHRKSSKNDSYL